MEDVQCMMVFVAAARWGLLDDLGTGPLTIDEVVTRYGETAALLVDAMCETGIVERTADDSGIVLSALTPCLENHIREFAAYLRHKGRVCEALLKVGPKTKRGTQTGQIPRTGEEEDYTRAMHFAALRRGLALPDTMDWTSCRNIIDAGCGSGYYSYLLLSQSDSMTATLVDYPEILTVTKEYTSSVGLQDRVRLVACNLLAASPPVSTHHDAALLFSVMHQYCFEENVAILRNLHEVLEDGARLLICDYISTETYHNHQAAAFALLMQAVTPNGQTYTMPEVNAMMAQAGFVVVDSLPADADGLTFVTCKCIKQGRSKP